jgi:hypothetical protein
MAYFFKKNMDSKSNNSKIAITTAILLGLGIVVSVSAINGYSISIANAGIIEGSENRGPPRAPMAVSEGNVYLVWWTNKTGNWEVMFRASNDGGATFADKINLSNTTEADSENAEIIASGNSVFVSWWENSLQNGTSESVLRISNDKGATFGPMMMLGQNGTIGSTESGGE